MTKTTKEQLIEACLWLGHISNDMEAMFLSGSQPTTYQKQGRHLILLNIELLAQRLSSETQLAQSTKENNHV